MLSPKKIKWRKPQKGNMRGMSNTGDYVSFGSYGLKALEPGWITSRQIESARIAISRRVNYMSGFLYRSKGRTVVKPITKKD